MALTKVTYSMIEGQYINVLDYGADKTGGTDTAAAIQAAVNAAAGRPIYFPAGTYRVDTTITFAPSSYVGDFGTGLKIYGDGPDNTIFDNRANGPLFDVFTAADITNFFATIGGEFRNFKIVRGASTVNGVGIKLSASFEYLISNVWINGMSSHGIEISCVLGDNDGSNMVHIDRTRVENCAGWGVKADADPGFNEISFLRLSHVFIQGCGTNVVGTPTSGGMIWKGQMLEATSSAFVLSENVGLFVPGQAGIANSVYLKNVAFENNKKRGLYCTGVQGFKGSSLHFYNNDSFTSTEQCEFDGSSFVVAQVEIDGAIVRATSGNSAITAFKLSGSNSDFNSCRVRNVSWQNFDYAGQTRFSGWQFDTVPFDCSMVVSDASTVVLRPSQIQGTGKTIPLRLRGPNNATGVGVASTSGEVVAHQMATSGIALNIAGFVANTRYYVYIYDNDGTPTLEASTTNFVTDTATGYAVQTGDATKIYVGSVLAGGINGTAATSGAGWVNPLVIPNSQTGVAAYIWTDATGDLRIKSTGADPANDTDGTIVGTQT